MIEMKAFLKAKGFIHHPFNTFDADKERDLQNFVVLPPYFESVFGIPEDPQPFLVLGMRGFGKTTLRRMLSDRIASQHKGQIFQIEYSNFPFTRQKEISQVTIKDHLLEFLRVLILELVPLLAESSELRKKLKNQHKVDLFHMMEIHFKEGEKELHYPRLQSLIEKLLRSYPQKQGRELFLSLETTEDEALERGLYAMDAMASILKALGYHSCYVFIDKLDETSKTMKEPEKAGLLLGPLIAALEVVQRDFYAFKFFVPAESVNNLKKCGLRNDKIQSQVISWTQEKLAEVLKKRIMAFNRDGKLLGRLGNVCEDEIRDKVDEFVLLKSENSPRNLLRFCNAIFAEHIETARSAEDPVSRKIVGLALKKYEYSLKIDQRMGAD